MEIYFLETFPKDFDPIDHHSIVALNPVVAWNMQFYGSYQYISPSQLVYPEEVQIELVKDAIKEFYGDNYVFFQCVSDVCRAEVYWRQFLIVYLRIVSNYQNKMYLDGMFEDNPYREDLKFHYCCYDPPMYPIFNGIIREWIFERKKR